MSEAIRGYQAAAQGLIDQYLAISPEALIAPARRWLPAAGRVLDIGAGPGLASRWFADQGFAVLAVEPVADFRRAGADHAGPEVAWIDDRLPDLHQARARGEAFDLVWCCAVWQHVAPQERRRAMQVIAALTAPGGRVIFSLRHGPGAPGRPVHAINVDETAALAKAQGLSEIGRCKADPIQAENKLAGVRWTWLALDAA